LQSTIHNLTTMTTALHCSWY